MKMDIDIRIAAKHFGGGKETLVADDFVSKIKDGSLKKDVLVENLTVRDDQSEFEDYQNYSSFLSSDVGKMLMEVLR